MRVVRHGDRGQLQAVLRPAPERVAPVCPHFGRCGGCARQHASDRFTALWKRDLVAAALVARGISGVAIRPTVTSPPESRRRITVAARRSRKGVLIGFHAPGAADIVPIETCTVAEPSLIAALPRLTHIVTMGKIAHESTVRALGGRVAGHPFGHGAVSRLETLALHASYHCSRYNTNTGRLTAEMFEAVFAQVRDAIGRGG